MQPISIDDYISNLEQASQILNTDPISVSESAAEKINKCRQYLDHKMSASDDLYYGINTGFGYLQNVKVDNAQLEKLQENLIKSHACGMGDEVPSTIVKLMLALKIKSLCYGHSGVQLKTVQIGRAHV